MNEMTEITIKTDYIKLNQLLKLASILSNGADYKIWILDNVVKQNDIQVTERGKKIYKGDILSINDTDFIKVL